MGFDELLQKLIDPLFIRYKLKNPKIKKKTEQTKMKTKNKILNEMR